MITQLFKKNFTWKKPDQCDVIQFGGDSVTGLAALSDEFRIGTMPSLGEIINLRVVVRGLRRRNWGRWGYYRQFLNDTRAKAVVVWQDTLVESYLLADRTNTPVFIVQNGIRHDISPTSGKGFLTSLRAIPHLRPSMTRYFALGPPAAELLRPLVEGEFVCSGGFRLNEYTRTRNHYDQQPAHKRRVGLIVSFPNRLEVPSQSLRGNTATFMRLADRDISFSDFFSIDRTVAEALAKVARECAWELSIIGKRSEAILETDYFSILPGCKDVPILSHAKGLGYTIAEGFDALVTIDSTLGYEMLALGKRVGFVSNRLHHAGIHSLEMSFGYPIQLPDDGPFWTSAITSRGIEDFLRRFLSLSDEEWSLAHSTYASQVTSCDPGNSLLRQALREKLALS